MFRRTVKLTKYCAKTELIVRTMNIQNNTRCLPFLDFTDDLYL